MAIFHAFSQETQRVVFSPPPSALPRIPGSESHLYDQAISLIAVGDLLMGGSALHVIQREGADYPFDSTRHVLSSADLTIANLEAPFTSGGTPFDKTYTFRVPPPFASSLPSAGFDVLTLANNHILDFGPEGLYSTLNTLDSLGIATCGAGKNATEAERGAILKKGRWNIGFLAYSLTFPTEFWATDSSCGTAYPRSPHIRQTIQEMREQVDLLVVAFHWGGELKADPKPYQRQYAHRAIDWGADLIIGHHPHTLQGMELYRDRLIAYSLGNFVFGSYSRNARDSIILRVRFDRLGLLYAEIFPITVFNLEVKFQPRLLRGKDRDRVIGTLNVISKDLNDGRDILRPSGLITLD